MNKSKDDQQDCNVQQENVSSLRDDQYFSDDTRAKPSVFTYIISEDIITHERITYEYHNNVNVKMYRSSNMGDSQVSTVSSSWNLSPIRSESQYNFGNHYCCSSASSFDDKGDAIHYLKSKKGNDKDLNSIFFNDPSLGERPNVNNIFKNFCSVINTNHGSSIENENENIYNMINDTSSGQLSFDLHDEEAINDKENIPYDYVKPKRPNRIPLKEIHVTDDYSEESSYGNKSDFISTDSLEFERCSNNSLEYSKDSLEVDHCSIESSEVDLFGIDSLEISPISMDCNEKKFRENIPENISLDEVSKGSIEYGTPNDFLKDDSLENVLSKDDESFYMFSEDSLNK